MSKLARQEAILEVIGHEPVWSQDELRGRLAKRGFRVTQGTLSRDIQQLGLAKTAGGYAVPETLHLVEPALPSLARLAQEFVLAIHEAQNLLVLKTTVGSAQPVAAALDGQKWPEVLGTIAGDDTILAVAPDQKSARRAALRLRELMS